MSLIAFADATDDVYGGLWFMYMYITLNVDVWYVSGGLCVYL